MEIIHRNTSKKAQVSMGRWCQEWSEEDEAYEVGKTVQDHLKWKDFVEDTKIISEL